MRRDAAALFLVAATAALLFAPSLGGGFVWDDRTLILENRYLDDWSHPGRALGADFFRRSGTEERIGHWRPAITLSYMVDRSLYGSSAAGYHAVNVLLHAIASCLLFCLSRALGLTRAASCLAGLLFAVHPVHVESVAWISGRTDLLCTVFSLAALLLDERRGRTGTAWTGAGVSALTLAGLLAKEMAAAVVVGAVLRALLLPTGRESRMGGRRAAVAAALAPAAAVALYLAIRFGLLGIVPEAPAAAAAGRATLFWTWWSGFLSYLRVLFWPADLGIVPRVGLAAGFAEPRVLAGLAAFAALAHGAVRTRRTFPALSWALSFFLLSLVPLTNFVAPIRAPAAVAFPWAERFLYLPSAGFVLAAAAAASAARGRFLRRAAWTAALLAILALGARSLARIPEWRDERALFAAEVERVPDSATARLGLADALAREGELDEAERLYREAATLAPTNAFAHFNFGNLLLRKGDVAGAERAYRDSIRIRPDLGKGWMNLGIALARQGRAGEAVEALERAARAMPRSAEARLNLANALRLAGRPAEAVPIFDEALTLDPSLAAAREGRAAAVREAGRGN